MSNDIFVRALNLIFLLMHFMNNVFYLEVVEGMFGISSRKRKLIAFSFLCTLVGTVMLVLFGSMSTLGYGIMLLVYFFTIMGFYPKQSLRTKLSAVLYFNLNIMSVRAIVAAVMSLVSGDDIYLLMQNERYFWMSLILTTIFCTLINLIMVSVIPRKFLRVMAQKNEHIFLFLTVLLSANIYLVLNGNVYIHTISYEYLPLHQIVAALTWMSAVFASIFNLVGFDIMRERREELEKDTIYKHFVESHSLWIVEVNCTQDKILRIIRNGIAEKLPTSSYTEYLYDETEEVVPAEDYQKVLSHESKENIIERFNNNEHQFSAEYRLHLNKGDTRWVRSTIAVKKESDTGDIIALVTVTDDIHEKKETEFALQDKAERDPLVGVLNKEAVEKQIESHLKVNCCGILFMIDLDNFKSINDNFGHAYGDDVLIEITEKITKNFRSDDLIGRIGGDEFIVFLKNSTNINEIERKATQLCKDIRKSYTHKDKNIEVIVSSSIGIAIAPEHGETFEELYKCADEAMYSRKKTDKNGYSVYLK